MLKRLRDELKLALPSDARIERTYPSWNQRSAGAFIWIIEPWNGGPIIGSQERVGDLLRYRHLMADPSWGDLSICQNEERIR
ncbi:MAG: hypothetical protein V3U03_17415 [Myxococcota bacterium]